MTDSSCDHALHARVEDAGINASAPREQRWIDGWLVRYSPGKAKRARCIQPVAAGRLSVDDKLALCLPVFRDAGLQPFVRMTPFAEPSGLEARLDALGWNAVDDSLVMVAKAGSGDPSAARSTALPGGFVIEPCDGASYASWIGAARGSSTGECDAHANRLAASPVPYCAFTVRDDRGETVAGGQIAIEGNIAGLYDVLTSASHRGRGIAAALCRHLMNEAVAKRATTLYLQVDAANAPAIAVYRRLGFEDAYSYRYRTLPDTAVA